LTNEYINGFYSTFTNGFYIGHVFYVFNVFFNFLELFTYMIYNAGEERVVSQKVKWFSVRSETNSQYRTVTKMVTDFSEL